MFKFKSIVTVLNFFTIKFKLNNAHTDIILSNYNTFSNIGV